MLQVIPEKRLLVFLPFPVAAVRYTFRYITRCLNRLLCSGDLRINKDRHTSGFFCVYSRLRYDHRNCFLKSGKREFFGRLHSCSVILFSRALCNSQSVLISSLLTSNDVFSLHRVSIKRGAYACFRRLLRVPVTCRHCQRFIILITCPGRFPKLPAKLFYFSRCRVRQVRPRPFGLVLFPLDDCILPWDYPIVNSFFGIIPLFYVLHKFARSVLCMLYTLPAVPNSARPESFHQIPPGPPAVIRAACFALSRVSVAVARFLGSGGIRAYPTGEMQ